MNRQVTLPAPAKLNLFLDIVGKREDGYHEITGVMQSVDLSDTVTVRIYDGVNITVSCDNTDIPADSRNIAHKAATLYMRNSGLRFWADIDIKKHIPVEAGLGGSSADGAAVLVALNRIFGVFNSEQLLKLGMEIGADVPFCLTLGTAYVGGAGESVVPLPFIDNAVYLIIKPDYSNNTREMYEKYDAAPAEVNKSGAEGFISAVMSGKFLENAGLMYNVFGDGGSRGICRELISLGAKGAAMTGSGSAVFGVFADYGSAERAAGQMNYPFKYVATAVSKV